MKREPEEVYEDCMNNCGMEFSDMTLKRQHESADCTANPTPATAGRDTEKRITIQKLLEHQKQVREDRRVTFEDWDRNSANLIAQYEAELRALLDNDKKGETP